MNKIEQAYHNSANAIIKRAVRDYRTALRHGLERTKRECEAFFRSEMFYGLTDLDGEMIMNRVKKSVM